MKITIKPYDTEWPRSFGQIREELTAAIGSLSPEIEHIGSTSVPGLGAKPIIDILVGVCKEKHLEEVIAPLIDCGYIYFEKYNADMPYRRLFLRQKTDPRTQSLPSVITEDMEIPTAIHEHDQRSAHIHVLVYDTEHWLRHIAFRDYLRSHPDTRERYQAIKEALSLREWADGNEYNGGKDWFIKEEERKALVWYKEKNR